jgi:hypothetical protein
MSARGGGGKRQPAAESVHSTICRSASRVAESKASTIAGT